MQATYQLGRQCLHSSAVSCSIKLLCIQSRRGGRSSHRPCCCQAAAQDQLQSQGSIGQQQSAPYSSSSHKQYPRFYSPQLPSAAGLSVELDPEEAKHAVRVLRLQTGDTIELCDGHGGLVQCEVAATSKSSAMVVATAEPQQQPWVGPQWVVAAACLTLKGGRTDWLVEKATELGAHSLLPLITARSQTGTNKDKFKSLMQKAGQKQRQRSSADGANSSGSLKSVLDSNSSSSDFQASRLERLAVAATKQSLRTHGLQVLPPVSLEQLLPQLQAAPISLVAVGGAPPVLQVLQQQWQQGVQQVQQQQQQQHAEGSSIPEAPSSSKHPWDGRPCYILIGPEGDFTPEEAECLSAAGVLPVGLGPHRLRTETAAILALSAAMLLGDSKAAHGS